MWGGAGVVCEGQDERGACVCVCVVETCSVVVRKEEIQESIIYLLSATCQTGENRTKGFSVQVNHTYMMKK